MRTTIAWVLGGVLCTATLLVGAAAPAGAASSSSSAKQWANGVCSAVQTFGDSVQSTLDDLKNASSVEDASGKVKSGLDDATQTLEKSLDDLGKPPTPDADEAQQAVQNLSKQLNDDVSAVEDLLSPPPSSPQEIASTFSQIGSEVQKAVSQVQSTATTLKGLKSSGSLQKAFQSASSCKQLKSSASQRSSS
jgi:ABC-type transporter Mla subunit MlaD